MGVVYHAIDLTLRREVAIKVLHPQYSGDPSFAQRFLREARSMARLDHPNIVGIYAVEKEQGSHYIVMEYFPGQDLKHILRERGPLPLPKTLHIATEITKALAYAHQKNIVHRDIKPGNIMVREGGNIKITDFGIVAALDESSATVTGTIMGTPEYMSPEQAKGEQVDSSCDLYSLGIVLYEMLTGTTPYKGMAGTSIVGKLAYDRSDQDLVFPPNIPLPLQYLIRGLTKKDSRERIKDATLVLETLKDHLNKLKASSSEIDLKSTITSSPPLVETEFIKSGPEDKADIQTPPTDLKGLGTTAAAKSPSLGSPKRAKSESISPPQPPPSRDILPREKPERTDQSFHKVRRLTIGLTASALLVGAGLILLNYWPLQENNQPSSPLTSKIKDTSAEAVRQPKIVAEKKQQQVAAIIQALERLHWEYTNEYTRQQETAQTLSAKIDNLQAQIKKIPIQATQEASGQEIKTVRQRLETLRQEVGEEQARQQTTQQALSQEAQNALNHANTAVLMVIEESQRDQLQTSRREVITAQLQLKGQQSSLSNKMDAKLTAVKATLGKTKDAIAELDRRRQDFDAQRLAKEREAVKKKEEAEQLRQKAEARAEAERQSQREAQEIQQQVSAAFQKLNNLNRELQEEHSRRNATTQTLLDQADTLLARLKHLSASPDRKNSQQKIENSQQRLKELRKQSLEEQIQRRNTEQVLSERIQEGLKEIAKIAHWKLDATQRKQLDKLQKEVVTTQSLLNNRQTVLRNDVETKFTAAQTVLNKAKDEIDHAAKKKEEEERQ